MTPQRILSDLAFSTNPESGLRMILYSVLQVSPKSAWANKMKSLRYKIRHLDVTLIFIVYVNHSTLTQLQIPWEEPCCYIQGDLTKHLIQSLHFTEEETDKEKGLGPWLYHHWLVRKPGLEHPCNWALFQYSASLVGLSFQQIHLETAFLPTPEQHLTLHLA